ncbi:hypothetical protein B0A49_02798 [Cryomyces minteri]|uniref:Alcohol dehydrogenase-like C-terminal domain-containing protein n=1 Tax=Cryomyces minteri TaxID=331657 RepID=A0A4V5NJT6_9PEZI|nr:hypothetical protein B0A49_02798 [Cryomyces minteri]
MSVRAGVPGTHTNTRNKIAIFLVVHGKGYRQYCAEARGFAYGELDQGAFGDYAMWDETFVYRIPDGIESREAAPLMCAGASVYEALDAAGTKPSDRVGIVGMGGLGHMALIFADSMGYAVTVFSNSERKMADATLMGADEFWMLKPPGEYVNLNGATAQSSTPSPINVLLITSNEVPDLGPLLPFLARRATIVLMTIQLKPLLVPYMAFILPGHRIIVSTEASRKNHLAMLEFADRKGAAPLIEEFPMTEAGLKLAFAKLERGEMRYRGVLVAQEPEHGRKRQRVSSESEDGD